MVKQSINPASEPTIFKFRTLVLFWFFMLSAFFFYQASQIKLDASFTKNIPLNHSYMKIYLKHQQDFGGANTILISVCDQESDIFNAHFLSTLKSVHDKLFFIPGIERTQVKSLFSPSTRFVDIIEDGFSGGPVIAASFQPTPAGLAELRANIEKASLTGSMVSNDYSCSMVKATLMDINPKTGQPLDTLKVAEQLEQKIRHQLENDKIQIQVIGFTKMVGDVATAAKEVAAFFALAIFITAILVYLFCHSLSLTFLPIVCSLIAVGWQLGALNLLGYGLDPMSILIPFLVFAIGVSHGVQMINSVKKLVIGGISTKEAAQVSFSILLIPGIIALLSDTVGFITLLSIDIGIIKELAITASLGVAMIILTNLLLLPLLISYLEIDLPVVPVEENKKIKRHPFWLAIAQCTDRGPATFILFVTACLFVGGFYFSQKINVGELHGGAPALHELSRYNQDTFAITDKYQISVDYLSVIVEGKPDACANPDIMSLIDRFQWHMENTPGVESAVSLASVAKKMNAGYNEGNLKWQVLPANQQELVQAISSVPSSSGLLNNDCSVMPIILYLEDHKADTITRVINATKRQIKNLHHDDIRFRLASGPAGVVAATNEAVSTAQLPMMLYVYGAVILLCLISFRSLRATIAVVLPLFIVSTLTQWLMTLMDIGLTVSTLPVIALGVGIGVDYGIYIVSSMRKHLINDKSLHFSYLEALEERGGAVLFTALTLAVGVSTWLLSDLKFQVDMGILLCFMFIVNMVGAIIVLPAIASFLWPSNQAKQKEDTRKFKL